MKPMQRRVCALSFLLVCLPWTGLHAAAPAAGAQVTDSGYQRPPAALQAIVDAPRPPTLMLAPRRDLAAMMQTPALPGIDVVAQPELKLAGVDAAAPTGTGVIMNVVAPRGGNVFRGSAIYDYQDVKWNSDNTSGGAVPGGLRPGSDLNGSTKKVESTPVSISV